MQCGICERDSRRLCCENCAQSAVWTLRYDILVRTAERDQAAERADEYLAQPASSVNVAARAAQARMRVAAVREESARLRAAVERDEAQRDRMRRANEARRKQLDDAAAVAAKQQLLLETVQRETKRLNQKWKALYARTAEARSYLCREAALLYGLRQKRRRSARADAAYLVGGVAIPHFLSDLNVHHHTHISTALSHLSHLLVLTSHYLGLKLPHEVVLPARDSPYPSIRGLLSTRHLSSRPLHLPAPLATLARDSPSQHTKFIEALSMLALDIAYLCFSQGLEINDVDEACAPGANLYRLLVPRDSAAVTNPAFGRASHATANGNLGTAPGGVMMSKFRLGYKPIAEKIRNTLQGEAIVADWDLVPEAEKQVPSAPGAGADGDASSASSPAGSRRASVSGSGLGSVNGWTRIKARGDRGGGGGGGG